MLALLIEWLFSISFAVIPLAAMRYKDVGDWHIHNGLISVIAADTGSRRYNFLILLHEAVEAKLCQRAGIREEVVDHFDTVEFPRWKSMLGKWEMPPDMVRILQTNSYGDWPTAPYHDQHVWATRVERIFAVLLLVRWQPYEDYINEMLREAA